MGYSSFGVLPFFSLCKKVEFRGWQSPVLGLHVSNHSFDSQYRKKKQINIFKRKITASRLSLVSVVLCHLDTLLHLESLMFVAFRLGVGLKEGKTKKNQ